jgi:hypothetical protein
VRLLSRLGNRATQLASVQWKEPFRSSAGRLMAGRGSRADRKVVWD